MALISQPGSDYQLTQLTLDAGRTRDITCLLLDVHAVLDQLHLDGTRPQITAAADAILRESGSPYTLPGADQRPGRSDQPAHPRHPPRHRRHNPAQPPGSGQLLMRKRGQIRAQLPSGNSSNVGPHQKRTVGPPGIDKASLSPRVIARLIDGD